MNEYPHIRSEFSGPQFSCCRCGNSVVCWPDTTAVPPQTWGSACPAAMRERIAALETERDKAQEDVSAATMAAAVGEAVTAALNGELVSDFMQSFGPVMEAQTIRSLLDLERRDTAVLWRTVKDACGWLHVTDDDESDWPKLPEYARRAVEEVARITAERESVEPLLADVRRLGDVVAEVALANPSLRDVVACNSVCDIAERMICRLIAELAEARKVGPRWVRSEDVGETPEEWRLTIGGRLCVPDAKIVRPAGMPPVVWILGRSFGTLHEAARAVCERLGLPLITEGLPKENADV